MAISISIWGTCSSRDIIGRGHKFDRGGVAEFRTDCYVESINPLAALTKSVALKEFLADAPRYDDALRGMINFHRRMLQIQINKEAFERIGAVHSDWFLLDCGALRFDLWKNKVEVDGARPETAYIEYCYKNQLKKLQKAGVIPAPDRTVRLENVPDEDFDRYMEKFTERILSMYDEERIILNELRPVEYYLNSERAGVFDSGGVSKWEKNIERGFAFLEGRLPKAHVIEFPCGVIADADHQWGLNAFHYVSEYYDYGYEALDLIAAGGCAREEERARLCDLKARYEELLRLKYGPFLAAKFQKACDAYYENMFPLARIELKDLGAASNRVDILDISDAAATEGEPNWLRDENGVGCIVESSAGRIELRLRCEGAGELQVALRGKNLRGAHGERVPRWVMYTSFEIDGERMFDGVVSVWHDRPYKTSRPVEDGQIVKISLSWQFQGQRSSYPDMDTNAHCKKPVAENDKLKAQVKDLEAENAKLRLQSEGFSREAETQKAEVERLRSSNSWKIGRAVTWLPRKIKRCLYHLRRGN